MGIEKTPRAPRHSGAAPVTLAGHGYEKDPSRTSAQWRSPDYPCGSWVRKRLLAHPPEPGYPCYVSVLGELAKVAPHEEPKFSLGYDAGRHQPGGGLRRWRRHPLETGKILWCRCFIATAARRIRLVAYGARLESVLGESPRGFESPILRHSVTAACWVTHKPHSQGSNPPFSAKRMPAARSPSAERGR